LPKLLKLPLSHQTPFEERSKLLVQVAVRAKWGEEIAKPAKKYRLDPAFAQYSEAALNLCVLSADFLKVSNAGEVKRIAKACRALDFPATSDVVDDENRLELSVLFSTATTEQWPLFSDPLQPRGDTGTEDIPFQAVQFRIDLRVVKPLR
jgi:hypothetical protein